MTKIRSISEIVLWAHDMEKALAFYRDVLGLEPISPPDPRGAVFLGAGDPRATCPQCIVLVPLPAGTPAFPADRTQRNMHHLGVEVSAEAFESESKRLEGLGYEVRFGEHPFLPLKGMYIDDPDGNEVELMAPRTV